MTLFIAVAAAFLVWALTDTSETSTIQTDINKKTDSLICTASIPKEPFFNDTIATDTIHEIKLLFDNNKPDKIFYSYTGTYDDEKKAKYYVSIMQADFNRFFGRQNIPTGIFSTTFTTIENKSKISIYSNMDKVNPTTSKIFFLDSDIFYNAKNYSNVELKSLYEGKGFSCEYNE